jgi:GT2 family glycosyltransferase
MTERNLATLVVAYRAADKLESCLQSVQRFLPGHDLHIWDNSEPAYPEVRRLAERYPDVYWHFSPVNIGFAAAVNRLAEAVPDDDLLLLNPDAELLSPLDATRALIRTPGTAAVAPLTDDEPGSAQRPSKFFSRTHEPWDIAHRKETFLIAMAGAAGFRDRLRGTPFSDFYKAQPYEVDGWLTGACLAISRDAWDALGPFDEEYFLYGEESHWEGLAREAGWRLFLADEVGVRHQAMGTVDGDKPGATRSKDLLRANAALSLEYRYGRFAADTFIAWLSLWEQFRVRLGKVIRSDARSDVAILVAGPPDIVKVRLSAALALSEAGRKVTVVSLQRLGELPRQLPASIRLVRGAFWWPSVAPEAMPSALLAGPTMREKVYSALFRLRRGRRILGYGEWKRDAD